MSRQPATVKLKGCPHCGGDIGVDRDGFGWYESCVQCGYLRDLMLVGGRLVPEEVPEEIMEKYRKREYPRKVVV